jgi:mannose-6-phosphate isomerase-like protein (cupin superfamily)
MDANDGLKVFTKALSNDSEKHFEILGRGDSVTMRSGLVTLLPGGDVGSHSTENYEELLIILDGVGEMEAAGIRHKISKGQIAYNPPQTIHNVYNTGKEPLKYIYVVAKAENQ